MISRETNRQQTIREQSEVDASAPHESEWQVIVIGAGVAGGMAALLCARAGLKTLLVERQHFPRHKVCGGCLNQKAVRLLDQAGLAQELLSRGPRAIDTTRFHAYGRTACVSVTGMLAVSRSTLDSVLAAAFVAAGGTFRDGTSATVMPEPTELPHCGRRTVRLHPSGGLGSTNGTGAFATPDVATPDVATTDIATTDIVLVCDGLGHPSLKRIPGALTQVAERSRLGLGCVIARSTSDNCYRENELQMAVGPSGYVGTVNIEGEQLNVAAAVDAESLRNGQAPLDILRRIYESAGLAAPVNLQRATIRGTPPLTRTTPPVVLPGIFLLGDAVGYVEPVTGEGMSWAMTAANLVIPLVQRAVCDGWDQSLHGDWNRLVQRHIVRRQRTCRLLAGSLRVPWLLSPMLAACRAFPGVADSIVRRLNSTAS